MSKLVYNEITSNKDQYPDLYAHLDKDGALAALKKKIDEQEGSDKKSFSESLDQMGDFGKFIKALLQMFSKLGETLQSLKKGPESGKPAPFAPSQNPEQAHERALQFAEADGDQATREQLIAYGNHVDSQRQNAATEVKRIQGKRTELREGMTDMREGKLQTINDDIATTEAQIPELDGEEKTEAENRLAQLREQKQELRNELDRAKEELARLKQEQEAAQARGKALEQELTVVRGMIEAGNFAAGESSEEGGAQEPQRVMSSGTINQESLGAAMRGDDSEST